MPNTISDNINNKIVAWLTIAINVVGEVHQVFFLKIENRLPLQGWLLECPTVFGIFEHSGKNEILDR